MHIEIQDSSVEARIQRQMRATDATSAEEALVHLLETQEEQDRWMMENKASINAKIRRGIEQLDKSQGIPEDRVAAHLEKLKSVAG